VSTHGPPVVASPPTGSGAEVAAEEEACHTPLSQNHHSRESRQHNLEPSPGLADGQADVVFLYDTYHDLAEPSRVLREMHRILKPAGILSFSDHHMKEGQILSEVAGTGLFSLSRRGKKTYSFLKQG